MSRYTRKQSHGKKKIILGITGGFGSGKSTVAGIFRSFGAKVIDADKIAHRLIRRKTKAYNKVIDVFGKGVLNRDKAIDRAKLAKIVFKDRGSLKKLNKILHPRVIKAIKEEIKSGHKRVIVLDVPLLIEAGLRKMVDKLVVVTATREKQIERTCNKKGFTRPDILKRIRAQIPLSRKIRLADFIIDNSSTLKKTKKQAEQIRRKLWKN